MKYRDLIEELEAAGWSYVKSEGSHRKYAHPDRKRPIIVPATNLGRDVPTGTLNAIYRQARLK